MDTAAIRVTQKEDEEQGIHEQDIFDGVVFFLAALTRFLFSRVLGADDASFSPVVGKRGDTNAATGDGTSSRESTAAVASASAPPSRCAKALRERAGASPRARRAARSAG